MQTKFSLSMFRRRKIKNFINKNIDARLNISGIYSRVQLIVVRNTVHDLVKIDICSFLNLPSKIIRSLYLLQFCLIYLILPKYGTRSVFITYVTNSERRLPNLRKIPFIFQNTNIAWPACLVYCSVLFGTVLYIQNHYIFKIYYTFQQYYLKQEHSIMRLI